MPFYSTDSECSSATNSGGISLCSRLLDSCADFFWSGSIKDTDTPVQRLRKQMLITGSIGVVFGVTAAMVSTPSFTRIRTIGNLVGASTGSALLADMFLSKRSLDDVYFTCVVAAFAFLTVCQDLDAASLSDAQLWPYFVLMLEGLLLARVPDRVVTAFTFFAMAWNFFIFIERFTRWGFFDLPGLATQDQRRERFDACGAVPCKRTVSEAFPPALNAFLVLVLTFWFALRFRQEADREKARVEASVDTAQCLANLLAASDLCGAEAELIGSRRLGRLPEGMASAFGQLLDNLRAYKPYLPQSCLPEFSGNIEGLELQSNQGGSSKSCGFSSATSGGFDRLSKGTELRRVRATLAVLNVRRSIALCDDDLAGFAAVMEEAVTIAEVVTFVHKGILDVICGDHIFLSFNAFRICPSHASLAVRAGFEFRTRCAACGPVVQTGRQVFDTNAGLASGLTVCGDLGSQSTRQNTTVGRLSVMAAALQRAATHLGKGLLVEQVLYTDCLTAFEMRCLPQGVTILKSSVSRIADLPVYEVLRAITPSESTLNEEWMYAMQCTPNCWDLYNEAMKRFIKGVPPRDVLIFLGEDKAQDSPSQESADVQRFTNELRKLLTLGKGLESIIITW